MTQTPLVVITCLLVFIAHTVSFVFNPIGPISSGFVNKYGCRAVTIAGTVIAGGKTNVVNKQKPLTHRFPFSSLHDS